MLPFEIASYESLCLTDVCSYSFFCSLLGLIPTVLEGFFNECLQEFIVVLCNLGLTVDVLKNLFSYMPAGIHGLFMPFGSH